MKNVILASVLALASASTFASVTAGLSITSGVVTSIEAVGCLAEGTTNEDRLCLAAASVSSAITSANLKEEMKQVEPDAFNFLAGEAMTAALEEQVEQVRRLSLETQGLNDQEVVFLIIESIK